MFLFLGGNGAHCVLSPHSRYTRFVAQPATPITHGICGDPLSHLQFTGSIGVITPYREQLSELKRRLRDEFPALNEDLSNNLAAQLPFTLQVNTVDGFQGQEKDIIIGNAELPHGRVIVVDYDWTASVPEWHPLCVACV